MDIYIYIYGFRVCTQEGSILSRVGPESTQNTMAAVIGNIWTEYMEVSKEVLKTNILDSMFITLRNTKLFVKRIGAFMLLIHAGSAVQMGNLRAKVHIYYMIYISLFRVKYYLNYWKRN